MKYIWQSPTWPILSYNAEELLVPLARCRRLQGQVLQRLAPLLGPLNGDASIASGVTLNNLQAEASVLEVEALATSKIEGIELSPHSVRSSIAHKLGIEHASLHTANRYEEGLIEVLLDATQQYKTPLTVERLCGWHAALFPSGHAGMHKITVGHWRSDSLGAMQVVSGMYGKKTIHYEAPPAESIAKEMDAFLTWFNSPSKEDSIIRAGIAHFWFVTLHPFDDGNGRLARIITDLALAQDEQIARRAYSFSAQIVGARKKYYMRLESAQKGSGDITVWLVWFIETLEKALQNANTIVAHSLAKAEFWQNFALTELNERQKKVVSKLVDLGPDCISGGFEGGLSNKNYMSMTKVSSATATRDLVDLVAKGLLTQQSGGRNTRYVLVWPNALEKG